MRYQIACLWLLLAALPAQQVHLAHYGNQPFAGWIRRGIEWKPEHQAGTVQRRCYAVGRDPGTGARVLDVHVTLKAGEQLR